MNNLTVKQLAGLLEAWPKRVAFFNDETIIECGACRAYFSSDKAWKAHRRSGTCDTNSLVRNPLGIWQARPRKRVRVQP